MIKLITRLIAWIRGLLLRRLTRIRSKLRMNSLREAIVQADDNKAQTGRKNLVAFNNHSGAYEALEKRLLKTAHRVQKSKGQPAQTKYRKARVKTVKSSRFTNDRIKTLENKSAYVTS